MNISLSLQTRLAIHQALQLTGGATETVFPQVEALLLNDREYQKALEYVAARKKHDRYESLMDFLFCELHPTYRFACWRYYAGNGPQLKELLTPEQLLAYNDRLLRALEVAITLFKEQRCKSWGLYRQEVEEAIGKAA